MVQQKSIKKRLVSESETDKKKPVEQGILNIVSKKKKTENGTVQNGQANKQMKKDVPKKFKNEKKTDKNVTVQSPKKKDTNEVGQEKIKTSSVKDEQRKLKLLEKRQEYREKRKLNREGKHYGLAIDLSVEDIKKKIEQIETRGNLTKSARRKLAALKKKLRAEEGTEKPVQVVKKQAEKSKKEKSVAVPKKIEVQSNEQKKKVQEKVEGKVLNKENKKKQNILLLSKQNKEEDEDEEEVDLDDEVSEDENESDVDLDEEEDDDDDEEEEEEDEDEDDEEEVDDEEDEDEEDEKNVQPKDSKIKVSNVQNPKEKGKPKNTEDESKKKRYVLFVGNLPYTITNDELKKHFLTKVGDIVDIRIPKKDANTARGFAYVELGNNVDYEKALSLHHSFVNGRRINVQYSGNNKKVGVAKNFKLHALKNAGKLAGGKGGYNQKFGGNKGRPNARTTKT